MPALKADGEDLAYITVQAVDKAGNPVPYANEMVNFKVKGDGRYRAAANGDPTSLDLFHLPRMLLILAVWAVPVGVSVFIPEVGFYLSIVWVLIGYSSLSYVTALLLRPIFRKLDENA